MDYFARFSRFVQSVPQLGSPPDGYVLHYVNHIDIDQGWSGPADFGRFIPALAGMSHSGLRDFHWHPTYLLPDGLGELDVVAAVSTRTIRSAKVLKA